MRQVITPQRILQIAEEARRGVPVPNSAVQDVAAYVAGRGFSTATLSRAGGRLAGILYGGKLIKGSDYLSIATVHYLRHCVVNAEWDVNVSQAEYEQDLALAITDVRSRIVLSRLFGAEQIGFVARTANVVRRPGHKTCKWCIVEYRSNVDGWVTGLQMVNGLQTLVSPNREAKLWLRRPL